MRTLAFLVCFTQALAGTAHAASEDPDWPCIQRRTGALSPGVMWPSPPADPEVRGDAADLAAALALRRVSLEEAEASVGDYAASHPDLSADDLGAIFLAAFERIDRDRQRILSGIVRYARSQIALAEQIDKKHAEMSALEAADPPDFDRMDELEAEIDWDERIYRDRERALTYVCETPVILEKRAYAIAQILLKHMPE